VLKRRQEAATRGVKRKLEKDIEEELGDDYILDLKKNYDLPDDYKYDIIPEMWEGHNIADYIDPDIFEVSYILKIWISLHHVSVHRVYMEVNLYSQGKNTLKWGPNLISRS
jgi:hypothetical protein